MHSDLRVKKALNHMEADRVPMDLGGTQTGIHRIAYLNLLKYLGLKEEIKIIDINQQLAQISEQVLKEMEIDTRYVIEPVEIELSEVKKGFIGYKDIWGVIRGEKKGRPITYLNIIENPLKDAKEADLDYYNWPDPFNESLFENAFCSAKKIKQTSNYAVVSRTIGVIFEACWKMRGMDTFFMDLIANPSFAEKLLDIMTDYQIKFCEGYLKKTGKYLDVVFTGDDIGMQNGPIISPKIYRELIKPRQKMVFDAIHRLTDAKICYHTCGAVSEFIEDFIEIGIDFLNPIQLSAANMDAKVLKAKFGHEIGFWGGGVDSQKELPFGTPKQVEEDVRWRVEVFKKGGGFVFNTIHSVQPDVPPENILKAFQAAKRYGVY